MLCVIWFVGDDEGIAPYGFANSKNISPSSQNMNTLYLNDITQRKKHQPFLIDVFILVRETGLEPVRRRHTHLKRACLPIPALARTQRLIL